MDPGTPRGGRLAPGDELLTPWPTYPLYPLLARRCGAQAVPARGARLEALVGAVTPRTRLVMLCSPNDPTGEVMSTEILRALLEELPERVVVVLDEALVDFTTSHPRDAALALLEDHPRFVVVRTFSKAWGLAGLRCGYALGGPGAEPLLERLAPPLGVGELAQAGALEALRSTADLVARRARTVAVERDVLTRRLRSLGTRYRATGAGRLSSAPQSAADWRSSTPVVCSRMRRQARVGSGSCAAACSTILRTRLPEISSPWRSQIAR